MARYVRVEPDNKVRIDTLQGPQVGWVNQLYIR